MPKGKTAPTSSAPAKKGTSNPAAAAHKAPAAIKGKQQPMKKQQVEEPVTTEDEDEDEEGSVLDTDASGSVLDTDDEDDEDDEEDDSEGDDDENDEDDDDDEDEEDSDSDGGDEFEQQSSDDSELESDGGLGSDSDSDSDAGLEPVEKSYRRPQKQLSTEDARRMLRGPPSGTQAQALAAKARGGAGGSTSAAGSGSKTDITAQLRDSVTDAQRLLNVDDLSSDDEDAAGNTIGRVPLHWYDAYDHIGYDAAGGKVTKRKPGQGDRLDLTIANRDEATKNTVYDAYNDRHVTLSERDMELIRRMQSGAFAHPEFDAMPEFTDYYSGIREVMPLSAAPEPKRRFTPSKWELMNVMKIAKAMKEGRYKTLEQREEEKRQALRGGAGGPEDKDSSEQGGVYQIWNDAEDEIVAESSSRRMKFHLPAPKMALPGHEESYNPPEEYLLTEEEIAARREAHDEFPAPGDDGEEGEGDVDKAAARRKQLQNGHNLPFFVPKKHSCMRHVGAYNNFIRERYERCLDLYLCPRTMKRRLNIDPASLIPKLPKPRELRPFPNSLCLQFVGHVGAVRTLSMSPDGGQFLATGGDDGTVRLWEVATAYCMHVWKVGRDVTSRVGTSSTATKTTVEPVLSVQWNPNPSHAVLAVAVGHRVVFITTGTGDADSTELTATLLSGVEHASESTGKSGDNVGDEDASDAEGEEEKKKPVSSSVKWTDVPADSASGSANSGPRVQLEFPTRVQSVAWHSKGDYLCTLTVADNLTVSDAKSVSVHQLSKCRTQYPFSKTVGRVQAVQFHPSRPFLFVATQQHVKIYHLVEQKLLKRLVSNCKWLSSMDVHGSGDHLIVGSYDRRVVWFDMDLSSTPYKTLKFHEKAVRCVQFHKRYPLMASASDDGSIHIFHAAVFNDLARNAMIVPLKILAGYHGNSSKGSSGSVVCVAFHPRQPWIASAGLDGVVNLFQDI